MDASKSESQVEVIPWDDFLTHHPPGSSALVKELATSSYRTMYKIHTPYLNLFCDSDECNGFRFFSRKSSKELLVHSNHWYDLIITYFCRNCEKTEKRFALRSCFKSYVGANRRSIRRVIAI